MAANQDTSIAKATSPLPAPWSSKATTKQDSTFQQLAPYIGRIKPDIARHLIMNFSKRNELVLDPFAGSGVIPFEAAMLGRRVLAADISPYAHLLTFAKFSAPIDLAQALKDFTIAWEASWLRRRNQDLRRVPRWVRKFFHSETLRNALALRDELVARSHHFLLACLLGILHHQRPGFLSFPSSHLVPYLRDRLFPRHDFPELYEERDVFVRMLAKLNRAYRRPPSTLGPSKILLTDSRQLALPGTVDVVITSPPYMNALDYIRDNRLRLWFLQRQLPVHTDDGRRKREELFRQLITDTFGRIVPRLKSNGRLVLILGDCRRGGTRRNSASIVSSIFQGPEFPGLNLVASYRDTIPDIRRARRQLIGTKRETVLIYEKSAPIMNRVMHG